MSMANEAIARVQVQACRSINEFAASKKRCVTAACGLECSNSLREINAVRVVGKHAEPMAALIPTNISIAGSLGNHLGTSRRTNELCWFSSKAFLKSAQRGRSRLVSSTRPHSSCARSFAAPSPVSVCIREYDINRSISPLRECSQKSGILLDLFIGASVGTSFSVAMFTNSTYVSFTASHPSRSVAMTSKRILLQRRPRCTSRSPSTNRRDRLSCLGFCACARS
jgi:hypothetical protein